MWFERELALSHAPEMLISLLINSTAPDPSSISRARRDMVVLRSHDKDETDDDYHHAHQYEIQFVRCTDLASASRIIKTFQIIFPLMLILNI